MKPCGYGGIYSDWVEYTGGNLNNTELLGCAAIKVFALNRQNTVCCAVIKVCAVIR